ncbi:hypothetical protein P9112_007657 [Eukaryota sp. TZLM1-RC]
MPQTTVLIASDGAKYQIEPEVANLCGYVSNIVNASGDNEIPVPGVSSLFLERALEFARFHLKATNSPSTVSDEEIIAWNRKYIIEVDKETLFQTLLAGNFLGMPALIDLCCKTIANMASNKTPEQLREVFDIPNDFEPTELEVLKQEFAAIFGM